MMGKQIRQLQLQQHPTNQQSRMDSSEIEMYYIILKTLEGSPFKDVAHLFYQKLEAYVTATRSDYTGANHPIDLYQVLLRYPNITHSTLGSILTRLTQNLNVNLPPSIHGVNSYLASGEFSLLRTKESLRLDEIQHSANALLTNKYYCPAYKNHSINIVKHLQARKLRGPVCARRSVPTEIYTRTVLFRKLMGHLSSVYCVLFDQTGQYIFTGADDHLIKIWSAKDGRLLKTLRGHEGEITDMSVNYENRLLASGGMDKVIRIWDLKTSKLIDCLNAHSAMVTSVKFAPYNRHGDDRYLVSTSNDGSVMFWIYNKDKFGFRKLQKFKERNRPNGRIVCSSFSEGGSFLACGSSDNYIHVYGFHPECGPYWIVELDLHQDQVDSVQFCNHGFRFITGSQDGTAVIWSYKKGSWKPLRLDMNTELVNDPFRNVDHPKVLIVQWSRDDRYVITSLSDNRIKIWDSITGQLLHTLNEHKHDVYLIESHPTDPRIFISASHDGTMCMWDIDRAKLLHKYMNRVDLLENISDVPGLASIYDVKFSPDGSMLACTDSYGYLSIYGVGSPEPYKHVPEQMFFHTDYRSLIRDLRYFVMDEQTHVAPHLMPRPTLVDMNGDPYNNALQRFVPDYKDGERIVVAPLSEDQIDRISERIEEYSKFEDEEYLAEKKSPADDLMMKASSSGSNLNHTYGTRSTDARYNTRYSTRHSFRSARSNFMPRSRRLRPRVRYFEEDDGPRVVPRERRTRPPQRAYRTLAHSDSSTEDDVRADNDNDHEDEDVDLDEEDSDDDTETEMDGDSTSDDETVIDSEATEIDEANTAEYNTRSRSRIIVTRNSGLSIQLRESESNIRRRSARLRDRKRLRRH